MSGSTILSYISILKGYDVHGGDERDLPESDFFQRDISLKITNLWFQSRFLVWIQIRKRHRSVMKLNPWQTTVSGRTRGIQPRKRWWGCFRWFPVPSYPARCRSWSERSCRVRVRSGHPGEGSSYVLPRPVKSRSVTRYGSFKLEWESFRREWPPWK